MAKKPLFLLVLFLVFTALLFAQGENLTFKIAVVGPGTPLYFWWGHIALVIENSATGESRFYDYGIFSFDNDNFFYNFAFGRLLYSCGVSATERNINTYRRTNRSIGFYTLDLPPETKIKVRDFADYNVLPQNRDYYYHHFRDNCSTRIRDIIDIATDGQFREQYENEPSRFTFRQHVRRHTWFSPVMDWVLNFWMGQVIDTPITVWDDMFLPAEVGKHIQDFWYTDANGTRRKLVVPDSYEEVYTATGRPKVLEVPRKQWPVQLSFSLVLSLVFGFFFFLYSKKIKAGRVLAGISMSLCGLVFGLAALLLYFMNLFTNHDYTYQNINMIFCTPLLLAAVPAGIGYAVTKNPQRLAVYDKILRVIWLLCVIGIFVSMLIKLLPGFYQQNLVDQMLMLPIALVFAFQPVGFKKGII
ncbi:MAG: DUF4105 domain-containing protein [Treponema sp.]|nr:DUF4105 domain-containing protein [Treponema sp.]